MSTPLSWIHSVEPQLKEVLDLPEISFIASLSLEDLSAFISSKLALSPLIFEMGEKGWRTKEAFFTGLGSSPVSISLQASPLEGEALWVMGYDDIKTFVSWIKEFEFDHPEVIRGVYRYAMLVALEGISKQELFQQFSFKLTKESPFAEKGYAIDIGLKRENEQIWGRLIFSPTLKESSMKFFSKDHLSISDLAKHLPHVQIPLSVVNGSIDLTQKELQSLQEGDFIILENAYFHPNEEKGSLKVLIQENPLFQVKYKEGRLKILDFIYAYEEVTVDA